MVLAMVEFCMNEIFFLQKSNITAGINCKVLLDFSLFAVIRYQNSARLNVVSTFPTKFNCQRYILQCLC